MKLSLQFLPLLGLTFVQPSMLADARVIENTPVAQTQSALNAAARFSEALGKGDSAAAAALLAADAIILESGERETRAQYLAEHLAADISFAKSLSPTRTVVDVRRQGDVVWITSTSVSRGRFEGRDINSVGAELIVLSRTKGKWLIRAIHWSSRRATG